MALTLGQVKTKAIQLIDEYSTTGTVTPAADNLDYTLRMNGLADAAQKEIAQHRKIHSVYSISQNPIDPQNGRSSGFDMQQFILTDIILQSTGSQSYYFEVDRQCSVVIEESISSVWTTLSTITAPSSVTSFTAYKGLITPSDVLNDVRLRFTGLYPYNIRNIALFAYTFPTDDDVPDYKPYTKYTMPTDFMELNKIIQQQDTRQYSDLNDYYWEGRKTFVLNYFYVGSFDIFYFKVPADIGDSAVDATTFEIDAEAIELIPYYIAGHVILEDQNLRPVGVTLLNEYQTKLMNLGSNEEEGFNEIQNVSGW